MNEFKLHLQQFIELLPVNKSISAPEAERRAGLFLQACAELAERRHFLGEDKIKLTTVKAITYREEQSKAEGKTVGERAAEVEASTPYIESREALESADNDINYLKAMHEVFLNAHLFYRSMAKEYNNG